VTLADLAAAGLGRGAVARRVAEGRLRRLHCGVFLVGPLPAARTREMAAVLACGESAVVSHRAAASLWGMRPPWQGEVDVTVTARHPRDKPGVRVHRVRHLDARDVTRRDGIPVTTVPRTLVDLSDVLTAHQLANVIHEAAFRKLFDERAVRAAMTRANGRHNLHVLSQALDLNKTGSAGTRSELEDRFLALTCKSGLPEPLVNTKVQDLEVDFHWPQLSLIVEVDGPGHTRPRTRHEHHERDKSLRAAGHTILRIPDHEIEQRPDAVTASLAVAAKF
jgi:hypothetical protein